MVSFSQTRDEWRDLRWTPCADWESTARKLGYSRSTVKPGEESGRSWQYGAFSSLPNVSQRLQKRIISADRHIDQGNELSNNNKRGYDLPRTRTLVKIGAYGPT
ncbi:hypothetical protein, variant [Exophiala dermatitidis NIH/UT8656]|uniref:Uncharacterized protein n=1 Tax=Exophiala dermatitidis (strain ATCC 34100 / CBS 525.76 / NIH/UT8656) TaxID=858893 RepID=H6BWW8_EXODN|nr:uncharacterized protein HMPREF1120_04222 [Exophiala dermatitidis NIH/UT8656]XP_009156586.1 hypothetical protein, variant [Exophiala dermatitidis NIH/UT8656]EHY56124.1 hypothetical protein, variant [Exophiala dermatitidis NIH/UT8656]EHY56125.1 hypothetical protein HMPREF1120_04222 [Exophiala dermatitidis NIH/UT8656]